MSKLNQSTSFNPTTMKTVNTIYLEHSEPLVEHTLGKHPTLSSNKNESISDPTSMTSNSLLKKPMIYMSNIKWQVGENLSQTIRVTDMLEALNKSPGGQNLRGNSFFRTGLRLELRLSSSPFHCGKLIFFYVPAGVELYSRQSIYCYCNFPCVYLDAANSTTAVLDIPFVAIKDYFSTQNPDSESDLGSVHIEVLNQLRIGTGGPTEVQLVLTIEPTINEIALPVLAHDISIQSLDTVLPALPGLSKIDSGMPSDITNLVSQLSSFASEGVSGALSKAPSVPSTSYLSKPHETVPPENQNNTTTINNVNRSAPTLSNVSGMGTEHLSLIPERTVARDIPTGEMNLLKIAQHPSLIAISQWPDSLDSNAQLIAIPIDPMLVATRATNQTEFVDHYPTYLSHVISPFAYWKGSIDYVFTFASTEQHKGKVLAAWIPFDSYENSSSILPSPTLEQLSLFPCEIFDLALNKEFTFSVPYNSETPYRRISEDFQRLLTSDQPVFSGSSNTDFSLGVLYLYVYNRLSHPSTVASTINFNVYIKAGSDFSFRCLKFTDDPYNVYQKINYIELQSSDVMYESTHMGMMKAPVNRIGISPSRVSPTSFQEDGSEENLGILLQKYYPQFGFKLPIDGNNTVKASIAVLPGLNVRAVSSSVLPDPRWRNLIAHYRDIFAFWEGSLNYFIIHNTTVNNPIILMASHDPTDFVGSISEVSLGTTGLRPNRYYVPIETSTALTSDDVDLSETSIYSHISNLRVNPTIEITTPHRSLYRRLYTTDIYLRDSSSPDKTTSCGQIDIVYSNPSDEIQAVSGVVYQAIGDDFQFKYLISPPRLLSRIASSTPPSGAELV